MMMRALYAEVKAREEYLAFGEQEALTPLAAEFVDASLFATWRQLAAHEEPAIAARIRELDPLGALADVSAAGTTVRISIHVAAEQRAVPRLSASVRRLLSMRPSGPAPASRSSGEQQEEASVEGAPAITNQRARRTATMPILLSRTMRTFALVQADIGLRIDDYEGRCCGSA
ncbi:hypothetical protein [Nocardia salmonicida]|uniref:hypothetical protein n=1 Tax=Nocardia salmonicida TaxID=53431 RepID=UPI0012F47B6E|nr:hypothetical protein [Nocardia salmonicida]MBC7299809.1 hypothetical protein [Nocardia sp.]